MLIRGLVENSNVSVEKRLPALLVAGGRDVWLGNAPGYALSSGPWGLQLYYETLKVVLSYLPMTVYRVLYPFIVLMHYGR